MKQKPNEEHWETKLSTLCVRRNTRKYNLYEQPLPEPFQDLTENSETTIATTEGPETNGQVDTLYWAGSRRTHRTPTTLAYKD